MKNLKIGIIELYLIINLAIALNSTSIWSIFTESP